LEEAIAKDTGGPRLPPVAPERRPLDVEMRLSIVATNSATAPIEQETVG